jgi:nitrite reductase/ring-hydroxylating ferredoxin subunit
MPEKIKLCELSDLSGILSKGFTVQTSRGNLELFLVSSADTIYAYINSCPHTGVCLDWTPDQFMDASGEYIQCATHGALFRITDGFCTYGPCAGTSLSPVTLQVHDSTLYLIWGN